MSTRKVDRLVEQLASPAYQGLKAAIAQVLGAPRQRCTVHFLRDMLGHVAKAQQPIAPRSDSAARGGRARRARLFAFPREHWSKLRSTHPLEQVTARSADARTSSASSPTTHP